MVWLFHEVLPAAAAMFQLTYSSTSFFAKDLQFGFLLVQVVPYICNHVTLDTSRAKTQS